MKFRTFNIITVACAVLVIVAVPLTVLTEAVVSNRVSSVEAIETVEPNFTDIVAQAVKNVVHVRCPNWQGSGVIIDEHIICTARHVVEGVEDFEVTFNDGRKAKATRAISDKEHDVGFIWVDEAMSNVAKIGSVKNCKLGQDIFIIGSPYGDINFNSVSKGIISGMNRNWDDINRRTGEPYGWEIAFTSDSAAHPGNSGGGVFTTDGVVRGILVGGYSPVLNCSMPCDLFLSDVEQIKLVFIMGKYEFEEEYKVSCPEY
jgi:S1-C subfamily serine protease